MLKTSITFAKQSNTTPMNNLTPLQEVASRIYAAKIAGAISNTKIKDIFYDVILDKSITEAKALLEATKPEPLDWLPCEYNGKLNYSKGGEFCAYETGGFFKLVNEFRGTPENCYQVGIFPTLDEAKAFAEHIRTR
jgi:hypothetical protein